MNLSLLTQIRKRLEESNALLVAVTKTFPPEVIQTAYDAGCRDFGENKVQEMVEKQHVLPNDIRWHLIGHLQSNKVKYIAPFVAMIHSVDSLRLLEEINKQAGKNGRTIDCLLQFHIASEESKFGLSREEAIELLESESYQNLHSIRLCGVMGMATFTDDTTRVQAEFRQLCSIFDWLKSSYFSSQPHFKEISMGMSGDWELALDEGSTMVRIGSLIFGDRNYEPDLRP